jgi:auxin-responsive protein IAA
VEPCSEEEEGHGNTGVSGQERPTMFVKVNLEGYAVGRKIDIKAHRGYTSLSEALQGMFHGFLSGVFGLYFTVPSCMIKLHLGHAADIYEVFD